LPYIPSAGNFVCVEVGEAARINDQLLRQGVIVRPIGNYGMPRHLRITIGLRAKTTAPLSHSSRCWVAEP